MRFRSIIFALASALLAASAAAKPIVNYTTSGTEGDYTLDFSVDNTLGGQNDIYFFGVDIPSGTITGEPASWINRNFDQAWSNSSRGGSSEVYNLSWIADDNLIAPGQTFSGFTVHVASLPTTVNYFAYATGGSYTGSDHIYTQYNPGFEGRANEGAAPEPASLLTLGLGGLAVLRRRKRAN